MEFVRIFGDEESLLAIKNNWKTKDEFRKKIKRIYI